MNNDRVTLKSPTEWYNSKYGSTIMTKSPEDWYNSTNSGKNVQDIQSYAKSKIESRPMLSIEEYYKLNSNKTVSKNKGSSMSNYVSRYTPSAKTIGKIGLGLGVAATAATVAYKYKGRNKNPYGIQYGDNSDDDDDKLPKQIPIVKSRSQELSMKEPSNINDGNSKTMQNIERYVPYFIYLHSKTYHRKQYKPLTKNYENYLIENMNKLNAGIIYENHDNNYTYLCMDDTETEETIKNINREIEDLTRKSKKVNVIFVIPRVNGRFEGAEVKIINDNNGNTLSFYNYCIKNIKHDNVRIIKNYVVMSKREENNDILARYGANAILKISFKNDLFLPNDPFQIVFIMPYNGSKEEFTEKLDYGGFCTRIIDYARNKNSSKTLLDKILYINHAQIKNDATRNDVEKQLTELNTIPVIIYQKNQTNIAEYNDIINRLFDGNGIDNEDRVRIKLAIEENDFQFVGNYIYENYRNVTLL